MAFIQDPRLRQTWNQLSHTTETVTSDAAAGIWTFGHRYVNPCLSSLAAAADAWCCAVCLGDRDERARRSAAAAAARRRTRARARAEYSFDFYDDWEDDFAADFLGGDDADADGDGLLGGGGGGGAGSRGILGGCARAAGGDGLRGGGVGGGAVSWGILGGYWDRLRGGTGAGGRRGGGGGGGAGAGDVVDQPRRRRGMSYGTRGAGRRKVAGDEDPNVIPRTAPLGFLGRLPFKIVGSLRYKPSAANLREHPGGGGAAGRGAEEREPLLGTAGDGEERGRQGKRPRSDTTTSGDTSSSYRSRNDLFPSDGEGDEDAVPLGDEFTVALERVDDRGSTRTRSSKGKRPADGDRDSGLSRTVSRSTIWSAQTPDESRGDSGTLPSAGGAEDVARVPSLEDLLREEEQAEREEHEEIERRRKAASRLAMQRGLSKDGRDTIGDLAEAKSPPQETQDATEDLVPAPRSQSATGEDAVGEQKTAPAGPPEPGPSPTMKMNGQPPGETTFVPARLPHFG